MKKLLFYTLLFGLSIIVACNKDDDKTQNPADLLPPATQTGKNTFGYLINGQPVIVRNTYLITAIYQGGLLQLGGGVNDNVRDIDLVIVLEDPLQKNISYNLTNFPIHRARYKDFNILDICEYNYQDTYEGSIKFSKIDRTNFILSGTFNFSTATEECDTIRITEGRFDINYIP